MPLFRISWPLFPQLATPHRRMEGVQNQAVSPDEAVRRWIRCEGRLTEERASLIRSLRGAASRVVTRGTLVPSSWFALWGGTPHQGQDQSTQPAATARDLLRWRSQCRFPGAHGADILAYRRTRSLHAVLPHSSMIRPMAYRPRAFQVPRPRPGHPPPPRRSARCLVFLRQRRGPPRSRSERSPAPTGNLRSSPPRRPAGSASPQVRPHIPRSLRRLPPETHRSSRAKCGERGGRPHCPVHRSRGGTASLSPAVHPMALRRPAAPARHRSVPARVRWP